MAPRFDRFYRYADLTAELRALVDAHADVLRMESIGTSFEGRDIWLVTATRFATGAPLDKPGFWVDANIHAVELTPSTLALYLLHRLATSADPAVARALDERTFYVVPRVNPDGAELALADRPRYLRSSVRPYPFDEETLEGLVPEDLDGDGCIRQMRVPDPHGAYKISDRDPRLMVRREPTERGGHYFRLLPEGQVRGYDGVSIAVPRAREGLDLNRNFPGRWRAEGEQPGAGPYPTSEPEVRALAAAISARPNICGSVALHTHSGVLLRPPGTTSEDEMPPEDLWTYRTIGAKGTELTGYPAISLFKDFRYHPKEIITGVCDDWLYEDLGVFSWTTELWSTRRAAGLPEGRWIEWYRDHPVEDDLKILAWSDAQLGEAGFRPWRPFDHPQLGPVEIGGWDYLHVVFNPPAALIEREIAPHADWIVWSALIGPQLVADATLTDLGDGTWRVRLVAQNAGWLPTYVTKRALARKIVRPVIAEIALDAGAELLAGKPRVELGQLEGRAYKPAGGFGHLVDPTTDRAKVEWIVRAPPGGAVRWTLRHDRAGRRTGTLGLTSSGRA